MAIIVRSRDSLLTTTSGYTNYRGVLNLVIILLVLSNARAALENIIKYGILVDPFSWIQFLREGSKHWPALAIMCSLSLHISISLVIEKIIAHLFQAPKGSRTGSGSSSSSGTESSFDSTESSSASVQPKNESSTGNRCSKVMMLADATLVVNLFACISLPAIAVYTFDTHPISASAALMLASIVFLKLVSYHMMNFWCRDLQRPKSQQSRTTKSFLRAYVPPIIDFGKKKVDDDDDADEDGDQSSMGGEKVKKETSTNWKEDGDKRSEKKEAIIIKSMAKYPDNVNLRDLCDFMLFPTLCYELEFARTERIRKRFLIKRTAELIILSQMVMGLVQQWIVPTVSNSVIPFRQMHYSHLLERLLKLAIPNHVIWLIWFYLFFHSMLNIAAELTRFADREFYRDWWNSESVYYFWSNWNIPVHKWCARHLYVPLIALGLTKCQASTAVFFVSAFFHEYLVSVPLKMFRMWAFTGMLVQLPWARFVSAHFNSHFANVAVWGSLIIGQPLCILMYYHDYYVINRA